MKYNVFPIIALLVMLSGPVAASGSDFSSWLNQARQEAVKKGYDSLRVQQAIESIEFLPSVIKLDRKQPEGSITIRQYHKNILSPQRISKGRKLYKKHRALLNEIGQKYGVNPIYIVALWGTETNYGGFTGNTHTLSALATLAFEGRRAAFFKAELFKALKIIDEGHINADAMKGSWAGALGQNQFMPSSFFRFAVDYDGDGKKDIWHTKADVFASTANYLKQSGWVSGERWGRIVTLSKDIDPALVGYKVKKPISDWANLGVQTEHGHALPHSNMQASLIQPNGPEGMSLLAYNNYLTLLKWNKSSYFVSAVGKLAEAISHNP